MITSMQRNHVLLLVLSVAIITIGVNISNIDAQKSDFKKYENTDYNIKIDYPSKWKTSENNLAQNQIVIFSAPELEEKESSVSSFIIIPARVAIASQQTPSTNMTLDNFTNYFIDNTYSSPTQYKIIDKSKTTLAGNEAVELLMYEYVGEQTSKVKRVFSLFDNDTAYMIKYTAEPGTFSKYLPIAQQMIDSFRPTTFLKNNITTTVNETPQENKNPLEIPTTVQVPSTDVNETKHEKKRPLEIPTTVPKFKKTYQLIIYLDNASSQNVIGDNFKILVYNSNNEPILSAKPTIDFNDDHQKISPPKGYPIVYQSGQYPKNINVCAQQEYTFNGTTNLHNDCYPVKQNFQKTYWYTTFDYGEIDGYVAESNSLAKSDEITPTTDTITPGNNPESNIQGTGNITGAEQIALKAEMKPHSIQFSSGFLNGSSEIKRFGFVASHGNEICPKNNCKYGVENGELSPNYNGGYSFDGKLKVTTQEEQVKKSKFYDLTVNLVKTSEEERNGHTIETLDGTVAIGPDITYDITNATLNVDDKNPVLTIQGERD